MHPIDWILWKIRDFKFKRRLAETSAEELCKQISERREKASLGDEDATISLKNVKLVVEQQQQTRSLRGGPSVNGPVTALCIVLALGVEGCSPQNRVEEEDRQGIHVALQIDEIQDAELDQLEGAVADHPDIREKFGKLVANMRLENDDRKAIHRQLLANFGQPKSPVQYDPAKMPDLLTRMKKAHSVTFWAMLGGAILSAGGIALGIARSPLAKLIPGFGNVFGAVDGVITGVEKWMAEKKQSGQEVHAQELAAMIYSVVGEDPHVAKLIDKRLVKVKAKLGLDDEEEPEPPAPPPPPAVVVTPAANA